jgi:hypothetical protein
LAAARREFGKGDERVKGAIKEFYKICMKGRIEFAKSTPDMLKYQPKRFWGLLCKNKQTCVDVSAETFADFN